MIQDYLKSHCDCHPLVTGVLAGLVNDYLPDKGNFDAWMADSGAQLDIADLDLVQKRNHILRTALAALPDNAHQLLSILSLLSEAVDYATLSALNPKLPPRPRKPGQPKNPEHWSNWAEMSDAAKERAQQEYQIALQGQEEYEQAVTAWQRSPEFRAASKDLTDAVHDLDRRGLLQYDNHTKRYDLHPVVRAVVSADLRREEMTRHGQHVVDCFSQKDYGLFQQVETLADLHERLQVVRILLRMEHYEEAFYVYLSDLTYALFDLSAYGITLSLLHPLFPQGWTTLPSVVDAWASGYLANDVAWALDIGGQPEEALRVYGIVISAALKITDLRGVRTALCNSSQTLARLNLLARQERCLVLALDLANLVGDKYHVFVAQLNRLVQLACMGQWADAETTWKLLEPMDRPLFPTAYRPGEAEFSYALFRFWHGSLAETHLAEAEQLAKEGRYRTGIRSVYALRGEWQIEQGRWALAADTLHEAVRLGREVGLRSVTAETQLALARFHLGQLRDPRAEIEQLETLRQPFHRGLAEFCLAIGQYEQAKKHALDAYSWAWADGEPYVHRYELDRSRNLLERLGVEIPTLPPYDSTKDETLPWEDQVAAAIEALRARKQQRRLPGEESGTSYRY